MILIENEYLDKLKYDDLIEKFALKKCKEKLFSLNWNHAIFSYNI